MKFVLLLALALAACTPQPSLPPLVSKAEAVDLLVDGSPQAAQPYKTILLAAVKRAWGLQGPVAVMAGQVHQESGWRTDAQSPVGAAGLSQFMPGTARDIEAKYPDLGPARPYDPLWALSALAQYDYDIHAQQSAATDCDRWGFTLAGYNGGPGWVVRDRRAAALQSLDSQRYWGSVETVNAGRNASAFAENRAYAPTIIRKRQPLYVAWGPAVCTELMG